MGKLISLDGLARFKDNLMTRINQLLAGKLDVNQGSINVGKFLTVGQDGAVTPIEFDPATYVDYNITIASTDWTAPQGVSNLYTYTYTNSNIQTNSGVQVLLLDGVRDNLVSDLLYDKNAGSITFSTESVIPGSVIPLTVRVINSTSDTVISFPIDDTAGAGDIDKAWSANKITSELSSIDLTSIIDDTSGVGDTDKVWSANKVYDEMYLKAPKSNPVFSDSISMGRKANTSVGNGSFAVGDNVEASGNYSQAEGNHTKAVADNSHVFGKYNFEGYKTEDFIDAASILSSGHLVLRPGGKFMYPSNAYRIFTYPNTVEIIDIATLELLIESYPSYYKTIDLVDPNNFAEIVGNGTSSKTSNARLLDWDGNEYLNGDIYVQCDTDSTNGTKLIPIPAYDSVQDEGKFLRIVNGAPTWVTIPPLNGGVF